MGIWHKTLQALGIQKELSAETRFFNQRLYQYLGMNTPVYKEGNDEAYITHGYQINHQLYSIVSWKAQKAALVDLAVYENKNGKHVKLEGHEVLEVLYRPNSMQGKAEFFEQFYGFKALTGNAYAYTPKLDFGTNKGKIKEMHVMPSQFTEIVSGGVFDPVKGYKFQWGDRIMDFTKDDVLHSRYANYNYENGSELYGMSPVQAAWKLLQKSNSNIESSKKGFDNQGAAGVLYEKATDSPMIGTLTKEQTEQLNRDLDKKIKGVNNKGRIFITSADLGYHNFGLSPADLKLIEDAQANFKDLCRVYHIPAEIFGDKDSATYNNVSEARKRGYTDGVLPDVKAFCSEFTRHILPAYGKNLILKPDTSNIEELQADKAKLAEWLNKAYWIKTQRKQELMDEEIDESLDPYFIPQGLIGSQEIKALDPLQQAQNLKSDYFNE